MNGSGNALFASFLVSFSFSIGDTFEASLSEKGGEVKSGRL